MITDGIVTAVLVWIAFTLDEILKELKKNDNSHQRPKTSDKKKLRF